MENKKDEFQFVNLSEKEIEKLKNLEETISAEQREDVILIAYKNDTN